MQRGMDGRLLQGMKMSKYRWITPHTGAAHMSQRRLLITLYELKVIQDLYWSWECSKWVIEDRHDE